jgi:DNA-binding response OmpR family regulator
MAIRPLQATVNPMREEMRGTPVATAIAHSLSVDPQRAGLQTAYRAEHAERGAPDSLSLLFRCFEVLPAERLLLRVRQPLKIGGRAFDLLILLLRARGTLVTKEQILHHVWPATVVDESSLRFQMASLRKILGDDGDAIKTIAGRGYVFVAEVVQSFHGWCDRENWGRVGRLCRNVRSPIVAVIDDDDSTRDALVGFLSSVGCRVTAFHSVQAFNNRHDSAIPECLVLDVWMPGQSGLEFQSELARQGFELPIIFISGRADVPMSVRAMKAGAVEFFTKPVRHEELLDAIRRAVGNWDGVRAGVSPP